MNDKGIEKQICLDDMEAKRKDIKILYDVALYCIKQNMCSINLIQQQFQFGFNRANKIIQTLEQLGIVSNKVGTKDREILVDASLLEKIFNDKLSDKEFNGIEDKIDLDVRQEVQKEDKQTLYDVALYCIKQNMCSINSIQKQFQFGFDRSYKIVQALEQLGIVSNKNGTKGREVLVDASLLERIFNNGD